jgi:zinc/manganese transport system substrate-binding protein
MKTGIRAATVWTHRESAHTAKFRPDFSSGRTLGKPRRGRFGYGVLAVLAAVSLTACSSHDNAADSSEKRAPTVVAATDVWGSVAKAVAGNDVKVTSILDNPSADPHSFRASPAQAAEISDAALVVYNGGGYDPWVDDVLRDHPNVPSVDAYSLLAKPAGEPQPANEHVFYDLATAKAVAAAIADQLTKTDPAHAADFRSRAAQFGKEADAVQQSELAIRAAHPGAAVVTTEPVAHYLLVTAGLTDKTPEAFSDAIEQDTDPAPVDLAAVLDLISGHQVAALIFNDQTVTNATKQVREAAQSAGVPVVSVTETLPAGTDYLSWQRDTADRLAAALQK